MADNGSKKGLSCSGMISAFVFVIACGVGLIFLMNRGASDKNKEETRASLTIATTLPGQTTEAYSEPETEIPVESDAEINEISTEDTTAPEETTETEAETTKTIEEQLDEQGYMWGNSSLKLAITKDCKGKNDGYSTTVYGVISNLSWKDYTYVQVTFSIYDSQGFKVGDALDNISGLRSGESWKFKALYVGGNGEKFRLEDVTAW